MTANPWRPVTVTEGNTPPLAEYRCQHCEERGKRTPVLFFVGYLGPGSVVYIKCHACNGRMVWQVA